MGEARRISKRYVGILCDRMLCICEVQVEDECRLTLDVGWRWTYMVHMREVGSRRMHRHRWCSLYCEIQFYVFFFKMYVQEVG